MVNLFLPVSDPCVALSEHVVWIIHIPIERDLLSRYIRVVAYGRGGCDAAFHVNAARLHLVGSTWRVYTVIVCLILSRLRAQLERHLLSMEERTHLVQ